MVNTCNNCNKPICKTHTFKPLNSVKTTIGVQKLCLTCFTEQDTRLTKNIELYSKDRYIWRRKMIVRFHKEYEYMTLIAENYGTLFTVYDHFDSYDDTDDNSSYFDS